MNRLLVVASGPLLALLCFGCVSEPLSKSYRPAPTIMPAPAVQAILVVVEEDGRPLKGRSRAGSGLLVCIPLVPYGHQQFALERIANMKPFPMEIGDTVVKDLRASGIAEYVDYQDGDDPRQRSLRDPYYLHITVKEGIWERYVTLYGTSFAGAFLWMAGFPVSYGSILTDLELDLRDSQGNSVREQTFKAKRGMTEWLIQPYSCAARLPGVYDQISQPMRSFIAEGVGAKR